jgi:hypothetical protein
MSIRPSETLKPSVSADDRANKQSSESLRLEQRQRTRAVAAHQLWRLWFLGGSRKNDKQKSDHSHRRAVIDPFGMPDYDAIGRIAVKAEALPHKAQSGDQGDNSDDSE